MVQPIKRDLGISDTEMSLLLGLAFAVFYTILGIPIGRLADRRSRRAIIAGSITLWTLMTAACGFAKGYWTLFLARIGVGIGEAGLTPAALSMISDYFPREKRGRALSVYNAGVGLGAAMAMILGGQVIQYISTQPPMTLPVVGQLFAWQTVFLVVGLPGLLVAALMLTVNEPFRRGKMKVETASGVTDDIPFSAVVAFVRQRWRSFASHFIGMSVVTIVGYAYFSWLPTTFIRTWGWNIGQISFAYGVIMLICVPLGVNLGGWLADRLYQRGYKDGHMRSNLWGAWLFLVPFSAIVPLMPSPELAIVMLVPASIGGAWVTATGAASIMMITPNQMRGQITAGYYFVISILGLTIGPSAVAVVTDFVFRDEAMLRYSVAWTVGIAGVFGLAVLHFNLPFFRRGVEEAESWLGAAPMPAK
jgi:MFS family permease